MQKKRIGFGFGFGLLALAAAVLAACSAGGSGGSIVPRAFQAADPSLRLSPPHRHRHPVSATVYLRIPPRRHRHHRRAHYISPGTLSISFTVTPIASSSGPAPTPMPVQTFNTTVPPCKRIAGSGGVLECQFDVKVMPGSDSFVATTYSQKNAAGKVLSEYSSGTVVIPTPNAKGQVAPLAFTFEGVIDHVVLQFPTTVVPADTKGQVGAVPVGVATAVPLNVSVYDAANYQIMSQVPATGTPVPYSAPVTLSISPTGSGFTLSNASGSGNSVTISNPNDLAVNVDYSGAFTASGGSVSSNTSFNIAATGTTLAQHPRKKIDVHAPRTATPAPNAAGIALAGNAIPGGTVATTLTTPIPLSLTNIGNTGNMEYFLTGYGAGAVVNAQMGTVSGGVPGTSGLFAGNIANANFTDHLGNLWVYDNATNQIDCFTAGNFAAPAGSITGASLFPGGGTPFVFNGFAEDSSNNLWFALYGTVTGFYFYSIGSVPINATSCTAPAASINITQPADSIGVFNVTAIPGTASVAVGYYDYTTGTGSILVGTNAVPTPNVSTAALGTGVSPGEMFGPPGSAYAFITSPSYSLGSVSAAGAFTNITTYDANVGGYLYGATSSGASSSGVLGITADDSGYSDSNAVVLLNPADTNAATNAEVLPIANQCQGIAFDAQDTAWTFCLNAANQPQFYHIVPTATWSVMPGTTVPVSLFGFTPPYTGSVYLSILEAFGSTSGPFTLQNYDTTIISGVTAEGDRGITFNMSIPNLGVIQTEADVVDSQGRSVHVTFHVDGIYSAGAPPRGGARRSFGRRGYPPLPRN